MKRVFPQKIKPVPSCAAGSDAVAGQIRQAISGSSRARTSAAMIGLAISMGASSLLLPQQGDGAVAAEPGAAEPALEVAELSPDAAVASEDATQLPQAETELSSAAAIADPSPQREGFSPKADAVNKNQTSAAVFEGEHEQTISPVTEIVPEDVTAGETDARKGAGGGATTLKPESFSAEQTANIEVASPVNKVQPQVLEPFTSTGELDSVLKAEQDVAFESLKEKQNRWENTRAELGYEESVSSKDEDYTQPVEALAAPSASQPMVESLKEVLAPTAPVLPGSIVSLGEAVRPPASAAVPPGEFAIAPSLGLGVMNPAPESVYPMPNMGANAQTMPPAPGVPNPEAGRGVGLPAHTRSLGVPLVNPVQKPEMGTVSPSPTAAVFPDRDAVRTPNQGVPLVNPVQNPEMPTVQNEPTAPEVKDAAAVGAGSDSPSPGISPVKPVNAGVNPEPEKAAVVEPDRSMAVKIEQEETAAAKWTFYQVNPGDTLDEIARKHGISEQAIIEANQINDPDLIEVEEKIKIPLPSADSSQGQKAALMPSLSPNATDSPSLSPATGETAQAVGVVPPNQTTTIAKLDIPLVPPLKSPERAGTFTVPAVAVNSATGAVGEGSARPLEAASDKPSPKQPDLSENPYVDGLRADIMKLRDKYRTTSADVQDKSEQALPVVSALTPSQTAGMVSLPIGEPMDYIPEIAAVDQSLDGAKPKESASSKATPKQTGTTDNPYVDGLRAEIAKLREKYRAEQARRERESSSAPQQVAPSANPQSPAATPSDPQQTPNKYNQILLGEINQMREKLRREQAQGEGNSTAPANEPQVSDRSTPPSPDGAVATAPLGSENYQPLVQPSLGQMVSPDLPPLLGPDNYLPKKPAIFNGYIWPAKGVLTSGYGWRWGRMHNGIDIAGPIGTPIHAAAPGVVSYAGYDDGGYGNLVEITHPDGSTTLYGHNDRVIVREGQPVDQGELISEMGSTGYSTGPHLHFEVHPPGQGAVNPIAYLPE